MKRKKQQQMRKQSSVARNTVAFQNPMYKDRNGPDENAALYGDFGGLDG